MANLRLVLAALSPLAAAAAMPVPTVLTQSFKDRLTTLNDATRELRAMGLHVVWSKMAGPLPQAHIRRDDGVSVARLLDRMGPRSFHPVEGGTLVSGEFMGVQVSFLQVDA
jgi:hypothetical protein